MLWLLSRASKHVCLKKDEVEKLESAILSQQIVLRCWEILHVEEKLRRDYGGDVIYAEIS